MHWPTPFVLLVTYAVSEGTSGVSKYRFPTDMKLILADQEHSGVMS